VKLPIDFVPFEPGPTISSIRRALAQKLSNEMIPSAFVALAALPRTGNTKIDRAVLPAPPLARPLVDTAFVAARTPIEEALTAIWTEVLKVDEIGIYDDFFELGGDSLLATQVAARVIDRLALAVSASTLLEAPTVEAMAVIILENLMREDR
jgi:acyl carrier protein